MVLNYQSFSVERQMAFKKYMRVRLFRAFKLSFTEQCSCSSVHELHRQQLTAYQAMKIKFVGK